MITAEVALYPLKTSNASDVINNSIHTLENSNVHYSVNSMNTHITGTKTQIFDSLEAMFTEAENAGQEVNMVITITNASN
jgi:uncharacterized protein YqgV (UPF0045/DUF77 family)